MTYLLQECKNDIQKLQHLKSAVLRERSSRLTLTPHNSVARVVDDEEHSEDTIDVVQEYLKHVLKFGTPEERVKILGGIQSKFKLTNRQLIFL